MLYKNMLYKKRLCFVLLVFFLIPNFFSGGCAPESASTPEYKQEPVFDEGLEEAPRVNSESRVLDEGDLFLIGIIQFADIPALDSAWLGIIDALISEGFIEGKNIKFDYRNAGGDFDECVAISESFVNDGVDLIISMATPATQAAALATKEIPVVFAAVTDPLRAGVVESWDRPNTNVTGVSDLNPVAALLEMALEITPGAKNLGVVYNANEVNSVVQVELSRGVAKELNVNIIEAAVTHPDEVYSAVEALAKEIDIIWVPSDNTAMTAFSSIVEVMEKNNTVVVGATIEFAELGAICATGFDYYDLGFQAGMLVAEVIRGGDPAVIPVQFPTEILIAVNMETSENIGYQVPFDVLLVADRIYQ